MKYLSSNCADEIISEMLLAIDENMQLVAWNTGIAHESALIPKQLHNMAIDTTLFSNKGENTQFSSKDHSSKRWWTKIFKQISALVFQNRFRNEPLVWAQLLPLLQRWGKGTDGKAGTLVRVEASTKPTPGSGAKANPSQTLSHFSLHFGRFPWAEFWVRSQEPGGEI